MSEREALARAIDIIKGPTKVGALFGIKGQAVSQWERCPANRVITLERATGGAVTRYELRPDLYPIEAPQEAAE